jgi:putative ABC transport system permease protein
MILLISWKNIWRSKVRSTVILVAISLGITAGIFNMGFYYGMGNQRVENAIKTEASHIQIHDTSYMTNPDIKLYFRDADKMKSEIESLPKVKSVSNRLVANSMATTAETGAGVQIIGIDPEAEKQVTDLYAKLISGSYFEGTKSKPILIGEKLAKKLDADVKNKIILHLQSVDGTMVRARFKVVGIYKTSNSQYDETNVFIRKTDLSNLIHIDKTAAHETAIFLHNNEDIDAVTKNLSEKYPNLSVLSWKKIMPEVGLVEGSMDISMYIIMVIILLALCFGIINTMLMAVLERVKEIGMLKAIGMNKLKVFTMIMYETVMISLTGGVVGLGLGYLTIVLTQKTGIDLSMYSEGWEALGYDPVIYPTIEPSKLLVVTLMVIATGMIASIYPAIKAIKLNPAEAIKVDM